MRANYEAIKALRVRTTGLSKAAIAGRVKPPIDPSLYSRIESGERPGTPAQLRAIADVLEVPLSAIAIFDDVPAAKPARVVKAS